MGWLGRLLGRESVPVVAAYTPHWEGAGGGRRFVGMPAQRTGPVAPVLAHAATLTARTHWLAANEPYVKHTIDLLCSGIVGDGVMPRSELDDMPELQSELHTLWDRFMREVDADGMTDGYGLQSLVIRSVLTGGDCFVRFRPRLATDRARFMPVPFSVPLQVQVLEAEMVPRDKNEDLGNGRRIKGGLQFSAFGALEGIHVYREHPHEFGVLARGSSETTFVPADAIAHVHEIQRAGQIRGVPRCAAVILPAHDYRTGEDALQQAWNLAAVLSGFIETSNPDDLPLLSPEEAEAAKAANEGKATVTLEAGEMPVLNPGEKFSQAKAPDVGPTYGVAVKTRLRRFCAGMGVPYSIGALDLEGTSYSSARIELLDFWARCDQFRSQTLQPQLLDPLWIMFVDTAVRAGKLSLSLAEYLRDPWKYLAVTWIPPKRPWVDPLNDVQGEVLAMEAGLAARDELILARGGIPERVDQSRERSKKRAETAGLTEGKPVATPQGARVTPPATEGPAPGQPARKAA